MPETGRAATYIEIDEALAVAKALFPNAVPARVQMPAYGGTYKVSLIEHRFLRSDIERGVTIDPYSGKVLLVSSAANLSFDQRLFAANEAVHTGDVFGVVGRALMALAGIMVLPQAVSGLAMWWKRTTRKSFIGHTRQGNGNLYEAFGGCSVACTRLCSWGRFGKMARLVSRKRR